MASIRQILTLLLVFVYQLATSQVASFDIDTNQVCALVNGNSRFTITNNSIPAGNRIFSDYTYSWKIGSLNPFNKADASFQQNLTSPGVYNIRLEMIYDNNVVSTKDSFFISRPYPNAWFIIADTFQVAPLTYRFRSGKSGTDTIAYNYVWKIDNKTDTFSFHPGVTGHDLLIYTFDTTIVHSGRHRMRLYVSDTFGCKDNFDTTFIISDKLEAPKFFTPNNDNKNDYFFVETNGRDVYRFEIFTSRGQLIFKSESPSIMWDGIIEDSGQPAPPGTYYYYIEPINKGSMPKKTGFFVLFREKK
jgi:gliding motility-associated-like protein